MYWDSVFVECCLFFFLPQDILKLILFIFSGRPTWDCVTYVIIREELYNMSRAWPRWIFTLSAALYTLDPGVRLPRRPRSQTSCPPTFSGISQNVLQMAFLSSVYQAHSSSMLHRSLLLSTDQSAGFWCWSLLAWERRPCSLLPLKLWDGWWHVSHSLSSMFKSWMPASWAIDNRSPVSHAFQQPSHAVCVCSFFAT